MEPLVLNTTQLDYLNADGNENTYFSVKKIKSMEASKLTDSV